MATVTMADLMHEILELKVLVSKLALQSSDKPVSKPKAKPAGDKPAAVGSGIGDKRDALIKEINNVVKEGKALDGSKDKFSESYFQSQTSGMDADKFKVLLASVGFKLTEAMASCKNKAELAKMVGLVGA